MFVRGTRAPEHGLTPGEMKIQLEGEKTLQAARLRSMEARIDAAELRATATATLNGRAPADEEEGAPTHV